MLVSFGLSGNKQVRLGVDQGLTSLAMPDGAGLSLPYDLWQAALGQPCGLTVRPVSSRSFFTGRSRAPGSREPSTGVASRGRQWYMAGSYMGTEVALEARNPTGWCVDP